jgi:hypothetical protein
MGQLSVSHMIVMFSSRATTDEAGCGLNKKSICELNSLRPIKVNDFSLTGGEKQTFEPEALLTIWSA